MLHAQTRRLCTRSCDSPADLEPLVRPVLVVGVDIRLERLMQGEKLVWCESQIRHVHPCALAGR